MAIGTLLALASLASSAFGAGKSARANRAIDQELNRQENELESWYNKEYNQNYIDTPEAQSTIQILQNQLKEQMKKVDQNNAITGASDETRVATADKVQSRLADSVTRLAGFGTQYKDAIRRQYMSQKFGQDQLKLGNLQGKSENWSNFANNAFNAFGGAVEADATGAFDEWDNKLGSWFKGLKGPKVTGTGPIITV